MTGRSSIRVLIVKGYSSSDQHSTLLCTIKPLCPLTLPRRRLQNLPRSCFSWRRAPFGRPPHRSYPPIAQLARGGWPRVLAVLAVGRGYPLRFLGGGAWWRVGSGGGVWHPRQLCDEAHSRMTHDVVSAIVVWRIPSELENVPEPRRG
jgi:hypothetical protein